MLRKIFATAREEQVIRQVSNSTWIGKFIPKQKYCCISTYSDDNIDHNVKNMNTSHIDEAHENDEADAKLPIDQEKQVSKMLDDAANFNELGNEWSTMPYPESALLPDNKPTRPTIDPADTAILMFPGQGALKVGHIAKYMKYPRVKELFEIGSEILGYDVLALCLNGPQEKLNKTEFNQVATVMTSLAALEKMWDNQPKTIENVKGVAGYSVGELTALIFSGALSVEDGIRLANIRGAAMQYASDLEPQRMITIMSKAATTKISKVCAEARNWALNMGVSEPVCKVAAYLYTETKVIAGHKQAIDFIESNYEKFKIRRVMPLPVSGAFHTSLMKPALKTFQKALNNIEIEDPRTAVYSNATIKPYRSAMDIRTILPKQMISPIKWEQIVYSIYKRKEGMNYPQTFDLGSNGTMKTILMRVYLPAGKECTVI